ncbi:hypothetical protein [Haloarchaeobius sp. DFWS5]|uniref:hypothetical protein n=1 Tax=Haloarchaeobius sp. DFWS5 TaxID=3446114 RepID=UPI003EBC4B0C
MVFEKLTLFEIRMDGAKFGGEGGVEIPTEADREADVEMESSESRSGASKALRLLALSVGLSLAATAVARRLASGEDDEAAEIEFEGVDEIPA